MDAALFPKASAPRRGLCGPRRGDKSRATAVIQGCAALYLVSAVATREHLVLGQEARDARCCSKRPPPPVRCRPESKSIVSVSADIDCSQVIRRFPQQYDRLRNRDELCRSHVAPFAPQGHRQYGRLPPTSPSISCVPSTSSKAFKIDAKRQDENPILAQSLNASPRNSDSGPNAWGDFSTSEIRSAGAAMLVDLPLRFSSTGI
jgi:hypothetical protein